MTSRAMVLGVILACVVAACSGGSEPDGAWSEVVTEGFVYSVAPLGEGFIASEDVDGTTRVLVSDDGLDWAVVDQAVVEEGEVLYWRDGGPLGAVGEVFDVGLPEVVSTLDGVTFTRADPLGDLGFSEVGIPGMAWGPTGILVAVSRGGEPIGLAASSDGVDWESVDLPTGLVDFVNPDGDPIAASETGYVVVGVLDGEGGPPGSAGNPGIQTWMSADLKSWTAEELSPAFVGAIDSPTAWREGYLVSGATFMPTSGDEGIWEGTTWSCPWGESWQSITLEGYSGGDSATVVDGSTLGVFAIAWNDAQDLDVLFSPDLSAWQVWPARSAFGTDDTMAMMWGDAAIGETAIVVPVAGNLRVAQP